LSPILSPVMKLGLSLWNKREDMSDIRFYLKESNSPRKTIIFLRYHKDGVNIKWQTGEKIEPKNWSKKDQKVKTSVDDHSHINSVLITQRRYFKGLLAEFLEQGHEIHPEKIKERMNAKFRTIETGRNEQEDLLLNLETYIEISRLTKSENTLKKFNTLKRTLIEFSKQNKGYSFLTFSHVDQTFYSKFIEFLLSKDIINETINKYFINLKTFLQWSFENGYNKNLLFKKFKSLKSSGDIYVLSNEDFLRMYQADLSDQPKLHSVRELFCLACLIGVRYSDFHKVNRENIHEHIDFQTQEKRYQLKITMEKTKETLTIPISPIALQILERNNFQFNVISNQKMNDYLKELGEYLGFDKKFSIQKNQGTGLKTIEKYAFERITCHTSRRTFVTLSLQRGMSMEVVMKIVGHKDVKTMQKYLKILPERAAEEINSAWKTFDQKLG